MTTLDYGVIGLYLAFATGVGLYAARRVAGSTTEYFVAGRSLPWWLAGSSMVATTFAADTPLAVTGLVATSGVAGNWLWWCVGIAHVVAALGFARLWRRLEVLTDAELVGRRYGGKWAQRLRTLTAGYQAVFINCLVMGWILVAMRKVSMALFPDFSPQLVTFLLLCLSMGYATLGGMHAVVLTDLMQLSLAFLGAGALAVFALEEHGGISGLTESFHVAYPEQASSMLSLIPDGDLPGLPLALFALLMTMGWWKNAQGAGYIVQRLSACKSPAEAEKGSLFFAVVHNALRPWPWILVGLAALLVWPLDGGTCLAAADCIHPYACLEGVCRVEDRESTYPLMMTRYLPAGWLGLVVASMLAAFMSTMDTHVNWGASYLVNDLKFGRDEGVPAPLWHGRVGAFVLGLTAFGLSQFMDSIADIWLVIIMLGGGIGSVWVGRWIWWRVSARVELVAMGSATLLALVVLAIQRENVLSVANPFFVGDLSKVHEIWIVTGGSLFCWVSSAWILPPEDPHVLESFYRSVRPPAAGWAPMKDLPHMEAPTTPTRTLALRIVLGLVAVFGTLLGVGTLLLGDGTAGLVGTLLGLSAFIWLLGHPLEEELERTIERHKGDGAP